jgi:hypothetical protein
MGTRGEGVMQEAEGFIVCLFVLNRTSNFSAIWRLPPLPMTGLQI